MQKKQHKNREKPNHVQAKSEHISLKFEKKNLDLNLIFVGVLTNAFKKTTTPHFKGFKVTASKLIFSHIPHNRSSHNHAGESIGLNVNFPGVKKGCLNYF